MKTVFTIAFSCIFTLISLSQTTSSIYLDGIFKSNRLKVKEIEVEIVNAEDQSIVKTLKIDGKFKESIPLDKSVTIYFRKEGYATKKIYIQKTNIENKKFRFQFDMEMLKTGKKVLKSSEPVAVLRYDQRRKGYIYDAKYTEKIKQDIKDKIKKS
jgi:hypothetical protein